jgi:spore germination protein
MFSSNEKISIRQLQILLILTLFSSVNLILPRIVTEYGEQNGWMIVIGATCLTVFYGYVITTLGKLFPDKTIVEYSCEILSKPIGILLCFALVFKEMIFASFEIRLFGELVKQTLLKDTPIEVIMIVMLFAVVYLTRKGYEARARIGEIIIFLALAPIILVLFFAFSEVQLDRLAPIFTLNYKDFFIGSVWISMMMTGVEILYIGIAYLRKTKYVTKAVTQSIIFVGILNLVIVLITVGVFGPLETSRQIWPVMSIMQVIELPGAFIARQDALMMSFWILTSFTLINCYIFFISILLSRIIKAKNANWLNLIVLPFIYIISLIPNNVPHTFEMMKTMIKYTGIIFVLPVPLLLLAITKIRKLGVKNEMDE